MVNQILRKCPKCKKQGYFEIKVGRRNCKIICPNCNLKIFFKCSKEIPEDLESYIHLRQKRYK